MPASPEASDPQERVGRGADAVCRRGLRDTVALIGEIQAHPPASERKALMRLLEGPARIEGRMLARLKRLSPAKAERTRVATLLRIFAREHGEDLAVLARPRRRLDTALARQLERDAPYNERLRRLSLSLGSKGCAAYFAGDLEG